MINNIYLKNFRGFNEINADFKQTASKTKRVSFIYGENGIGKSNLIKSISFLKSLIKVKSVAKLRSTLKIDNLASDDIKDFFKNTLPTTEFLIKNNKHKSTDNQEMIIKIDFTFNNKNGSYEIRCNDSKPIFEELKFEKNERLATVFTFTESKEDDWFDFDYIFKTNKAKEDLYYEADKFRGIYTFLTSYLAFIEEANKDFIIDNINFDFFQIINYLTSITVIDNKTIDSFYEISDSRFARLVKGTFQVNDDDFKNELENRANQLTLFFSSLYTNVLEVKYKTEIVNKQYVYNLVFVEKDSVNGNLMEIDFDLLSSGTKKLFQTFMALNTFIEGETVLIDEIDSGVHDLVMKDIISQVLEYSKANNCGQIIATTHNTLLMRELKPANIYVINQNANGVRELYSLDCFNKEIQSTNNIAKRYLQGLYGGIPYTCVSLDSLAESFKK